MGRAGAALFLLLVSPLILGYIWDSVDAKEGKFFDNNKITNGFEDIGEKVFEGSKGEGSLIKMDQRAMHVSSDNDVQGDANNSYVYIVEGDDLELNEEEVSHIMREMKRKETNRVETNEYVAEKIGKMLYIKEKERESSLLPSEHIKHLVRTLGVEFNVQDIVARGKVETRFEGREKIVVKLVKIEGDAVIGKSLIFRKDVNEAEVNVFLVSQRGGVLLVEENIPKDVNVTSLLSSGYAILNFDPVIAWVLELNSGEIGKVTYRVKGRVPPELEPSVSFLKGCDVGIRFKSLKTIDGKVVGELQVLLSGHPVYTPDIKLNGVYTFVKDSMSYVFEANVSRLVVEGKVGSCPFYKEVGGGASTELIVPTLLLLLIIIAVFLFYIRH